MDFKKLKKDNDNAYYTFGWLIKHSIIIAISIIPAFIWAEYKSTAESFSVAILMIIVLSVVIFIGDILRRITKPDSIISEGGAFELLKKKIYWSIGPQFAAAFFTYITIFIFGTLLSSENNIKFVKRGQQTIEIETVDENLGDSSYDID